MLYGSKQHAEILTCGLQPFGLVRERCSRPWQPCRTDT